jgi:hypothetical protein
VRNTSGTVLPLGIPRIAEEVAEESGSRVPQSCCWETLHKVSGRTAQWNEAGACNACNGFLLGSIVTLKTPGPPFKMPCGTVRFRSRATRWPASGGPRRAQFVADAAFYKIFCRACPVGISARVLLYWTSYFFFYNTSCTSNKSLQGVVPPQRLQRHSPREKWRRPNCHPVGKRLAL